MPWQPIGPNPQLQWPLPTSPFAEKVSGRVSALALSRNGALFLGTASGGIWRCQNLAANPVVWAAVSDNVMRPSQTDNLPLTEFTVNGPNNIIGGDALACGTADTGCLAVDAYNQNIIYVGTGEANYSADSRYGAGVMRSADGGSSWRLMAVGTAGIPAVFFGKSISKLVVDWSGPQRNGASQYLYAAVVPSPVGPGSPAADMGIYESPDGGVSWTKLNTPNAPWQVTDLAATVDHNGVFRLFAGVGQPYPYLAVPVANRGIWVGTFTVHAGTRQWAWRHAALANAPAFPILRVSLASDYRRIARAQNNEPLVYAAIAYSPPAAAPGAPPARALEVFRTSDNGTTWARPYTPGAAPPGDVLQILGVYGWYSLAIAIKDSNPNVVYVGGQGAVPNTFADFTAAATMRGVIQSVDGGMTWVAIDNLGAGDQAAGPRGPFVVPHPDHHAFLAVGNAAFNGNDGGIFRFNALPPDQAGRDQPGLQRTRAWSDLNIALQTNQIYGVASDNGAANSLVLVEGSQDNGAAKATGLRGPWTTLAFMGCSLAGDGGQVRFDRAGFVAYQILDCVPGGGPGVRGTDNGGRTWSDVTAQGPIRQDTTFPDLPALAFSPTPHGVVGNGRRITRYWAAIGSTQLWQREAVPVPNNPRANWVWQWRRLRPAIPGNPKITAIAYASDNTIYVAYDNGTIHRSANAQAANPATWVTVGPPGAGPANWGTARINGITVDPNNANVIYIAVTSFLTGQQVFRATFAPGVAPAWAPLSGQPRLPKLPTVPTFAIVVDPRPVQVPRQPRVVAPLYAANDAGVYFSLDQGASWARLGRSMTNPFVQNAQAPDLPYGRVQDLTLNTNSDVHLLIAGTHGRGVYTLDYNQVVRNAAPRASTMEGTPGNNLPLGTFTDAAGIDPVSNYSVKINWGDGSPTDTTTGVVTATGSTLSVTGSHTFTEAGIYYVSTEVDDSDGTPAVYLNAVVQVLEASLSASPVNINGAVGMPLVNVPVANFVDSNSSSTASEFTALVSWGDGTSSAGAITGGAGNFQVSGGHTYTNAGQFAVTVTVYETDGTTASASGSAAISGALAMQAAAFAATEGTSTGSVVVATFTDSYPNAQPGDYSVTINWGDGHISQGNVSSTGQGGFNITGSNTYGTAGFFDLAIALNNVRGASANITSSVQVSDAALTATGTTFTATQGIPLANTVVGTFSDLNGSDAVGSYASSVDWGDGNQSDATIIPLGGGNFAIIASNSYALPGAYSVSVSVSDVAGNSASTTSTLNVAPAGPAVSSVSPQFGSPAGGTPVSVQGSALAGVTAVMFGTVPALAFQVNADGSITAVAPPGSGTVDVTVTTPQGTSAANPADLFTYLAGPPAVTGVSPPSGATGGGNSVTISGTNLAGATQVYFGGVPADGFSVLSDIAIVATVPAQASGAVDVTVAGPYGVSATSGADQYAYVAAPPAVSGTDTPSGPAAGGNQVTIFGNNLNGATQVNFGAMPAAGFTVQSASTVVATVPAGAPRASCN